MKYFIITVSNYICLFTMSKLDPPKEILYLANKQYHPYLPSNTKGVKKYITCQGWCVMYL